MAKRSEYLSEEDVTFGQLCRLFDQAMMKYKVDGDGDIVLAFGPYRVQVLLEEAQKLICLSMFFPLKGKKPLQEAFANRLNAHVYYCNFYANNNNMTAKYYVGYEGGLLSHQLIGHVHRLKEVASSALLHLDNDKLLHLPSSISSTAAPTTRKLGRTKVVKLGRGGS